MRQLTLSQQGGSALSKLVRGFFTVRASQASDGGAGSAAGASGKRRRVLVGGGSGFVGTELARHLRRRGYDVVVVSRSAGKDEAGQERLTWDRLESEGLPEGTRAVVNLAGANILDPLKRWTSAFKQEVYDSRIHTTRAVASAINAAPPAQRPGVYVQISGVGIYPVDDFTGKAPLDETSPKVADDFWGVLANDWERASRLSKEAEQDTRRVIVRSGVVLGRTGGLIQRIFPPFFLGLGGRMGSGDQFLPWIHVKDLVGLITFAIESDHVRGVLNGTAPDVVTNREFVRAFAGALGRPAVIPLPGVVWWMVFGDERASIITQGQKVQCKRTMETGYEFRYPKIEDACKEFTGLFYKDVDAAER